MKLSDDGVLGSVGHMGWSVMCGRCSLCPSVGSLPGCTTPYLWWSSTSGPRELTWLFTSWAFVLGCCLQAVYPRGGRISAGDFLVHLATGTARVVSLHGRLTSCLLSVQDSQLGCLWNLVPYK